MAYSTALAHASSSSEGWAILHLMDPSISSSSSSSISSSFSIEEEEGGGGEERGESSHPPTPPNDVTYTSLIHLLGREGKLEEAASLLSSLPSRGVSPSSITVCAYLNALLKQGKAREVQAFIHSSLEALGVKKDAKIHAMYLSSLLSQRRPMSEMLAYLSRRRRVGGEWMGSFTGC